MDKVTAIVVLVFMASRTSKGFQGLRRDVVKLPKASSFSSSQSARQSGTPGSAWTNIALHSPLSLATVCLWVKATDVKRTGSLFMYSTTTSRHAFGLVSMKSPESEPGIQAASVESDYMLYLIVQGRKSSKPVSLRMDDVRWHYVCVSWKSSGHWKVFIDGDELGVGFDLPTSQPLDKYGRLYIGGVPPSLTYKYQPFTGKMTGLTVWNTSLSTELINYAGNCRNFNRRQRLGTNFARAATEDSSLQAPERLVSALAYEWETRTIRTQWPASLYPSEDVCGTEVTVECNTNQMIISVNASRPRRLKIAQSHLHLNHGNCTPIVRGRKGDFYVFDVSDFTKCGTTTEVTETEVIYRNRVSNSPVTTRVIFFGFLYSADVRCHYPIDLKVSTRFVPPENDTLMSRTVMRDPRTNREDMETVVLVYRDKAFKETFQNQPVIKPTDNIYVGMVVQSNLTEEYGSDYNVNVVVDRCYVRSLRQRKKIIDNQGCWSASPDIAMLENGRRSQVRYKLPSSALSFTNGPVFLDCAVHPCIGSSCAPKCDDNARPSQLSRGSVRQSGSRSSLARRRAKRQVIDTDNPQPEYYDITIGPMYARGFWPREDQIQRLPVRRRSYEKVYEDPLFLGLLTALCVVTAVGFILIATVVRIKRQSEIGSINPVQITKHERRRSTDDSLASERPTSVTSPEPSICSVVRADSYASVHSLTSFNTFASYESHYSQGNLDQLSVDSLRFSASWH